MQLKRQQLLLPLLFASIHLVFILHLFHESSEDTPNHFLLLALLPLPFYFMLPFDSAKLHTAILIKTTLAFSAGFLVTIFLQNYFTTVISSTLVATIFVLISEIKTLKLTDYQGALYAGTFGGMLSSDWITNNLGIIISCVAGGTLFSVFNNSLQGFGGKMGTIGFGSLIMWIIVQW
jgi:hypothetical protein